MEHVWIARRYFESREVYFQVFAEDEKKRAKINVAQKKGAIPEDFVWSPISHKEDESVEATSEENESIELNERLVVQKKYVKP